MPGDIRDKPSVGHEDVVRLNFIRSDGIYHYRRHHRTGLRSHVLEVLLRTDVESETRGKVIDGVRWFPRARPLKMLRLFRRRFAHAGEVWDETRRVKTIERFLRPENMARSSEFAVDYRTAGRYDPMLCGLQEFVTGTPLDPWQRLGPDALRIAADAGNGVSAGGAADTAADFLCNLRSSVDRFIRGIKRMIRDTDQVPDLAGEGNLLLTPSGEVRLVDINNISRVSLIPAIYRDDIGYPVCDKSIEALSLLERHVACRPPDLAERVYRHFLDPGRMRRVRELDRSFHETVNPEEGGRQVNG